MSTQASQSKPGPETQSDHQPEVKEIGHVTKTPSTPGQSTMQAWDGHGKMMERFLREFFAGCVTPLRAKIAYDLAQQVLNGAISPYKFEVEIWQQLKYYKRSMISGVTYGSPHLRHMMTFGGLRIEGLAPPLQAALSLGFYLPTPSELALSEKVAEAALIHDLKRKSAVAQREAAAHGAPAKRRRKSDSILGHTLHHTQNPPFHPHHPSSHPSSSSQGYQSPSPAMPSQILHYPSSFPQPNLPPQPSFYYSNPPPPPQPTLPPVRNSNPPGNFYPGGDGFFRPPDGGMPAAQGPSGRLFEPYTKFSYNCAYCKEPFGGLAEGAVPDKDVWYDLHFPMGADGSECLRKAGGNVCLRPGSTVSLVEGGMVLEKAHCGWCKGREIDSKKMELHVQVAHGGRLAEERVEAAPNVAFSHHPQNPSPNHMAQPLPTETYSAQRPSLPHPVSHRQSPVTPHSGMLSLGQVVERQIETTVGSKSPGLRNFLQPAQAQLLTTDNCSGLRQLLQAPSVHYNDYQKSQSGMPGQFEHLLRQSHSNPSPAPPLTIQQPSGTQTYLVFVPTPPARAPPIIGQKSVAPSRNNMAFAPYGRSVPVNSSQPPKSNPPGSRGFRQLLPAPTARLDYPGGIAQSAGSRRTAVQGDRVSVDAVAKGYSSTVSWTDASETGLESLACGSEVRLLADGLGSQRNMGNAMDGSLDEILLALEGIACVKQNQHHLTATTPPTETVPNQPTSRITAQNHLPRSLPSSSTPSSVSGPLSTPIPPSRPESIESHSQSPFPLEISLHQLPLSTQTPNTAQAPLLPPDSTHFDSAPLESNISSSKDQDTPETTSNQPTNPVSAATSSSTSTPSDSSPSTPFPPEKRKSPLDEPDFTPSDEDTAKKVKREPLDGDADDFPGDNTYVCFCAAVFPSMTQLGRHQQRHLPLDRLGEVKNDLLCNHAKCGYLAVDLADLTRHWARHIYMQYLCRSQMAADKEDEQGKK